MKDQKKTGVIISYVNIVMSMLSHIVIVPMLIGHLSDVDYGIYKVMQSFAGPLIMFNMGLSTVTARCVAKFRATEDDNSKEKENTLALSAIISVVMSVIVILVGLVMMGSIDYIFAKTYTGENLAVAKQVFIVFVLSTATYIIKDMLRGCVLGNEKFIFYFGTVTLQHIMRFVLLAFLIFIGVDVVAITAVDLIIGIVLTLATLIYVKVVLHERFKLYSVDKAEVFSIFSFSLSILLQVIISQVNSNLDNVILGATTTDAVVITMYSSALSIVLTYNSIMSVMVSIFFPNATALVTRNSSGEELTDFVIKAGRIQVILALAVLGGFALFGKNFIALWIGEKYLSAYYVTLVMMLSQTIPLVQNVCLAILDAKLKRMFRSVVLSLMAGANAIVSLILVQYIGFWGAAIGTVASVILGDVIVMNIYYRKVIKLNVIRMLREMFKGFWLAGLLSVIGCIPLTFLPDSFIGFIAKGVIFVIVYAVLLWLLALNKEEKQYITSFINKKSKKAN